MWCRLAVRISGLRVTIVVWQPAAWKNEPYSMATFDPPMITQLVGFVVQVLDQPGEVVTRRADPMPGMSGYDGVRAGAQHQVAAR